MRLLIAKSLIFVLGAILVEGCESSNPSEVMQPMYAFYKKNHWIPLPEPDSRFSPGAIFTFTPEQGIRWLSSLATCKIPADILSPQTGGSGSLTFNTDSEYGASAVLKVNGVSAGPEYNRVKKTGLTLEQHGGSSIDMIKVRLWLNNPENAKSFPQVCREVLSQPNTYVAQESYVVSKGKYTLVDQNNAKVGVKGVNIGPVKFDPNAHIKANADGTLEFDQTLYTAVRRIQYLNGDWRSLGSNIGQTADERLLQQLRY